MRRFFNWLFRAFKPDTTKYVKNIGSDSVAKKQDSSFVAVKRKKPSKPVLAWISTALIQENKEDNSGVSIQISLKGDAQFKVINSDKFEVTSKKKGLSLVEHKVTIDPEKNEFEEISNSAKDGNLSFLYRSSEGDLFFIGERNGLALISSTDNQLNFKGDEPDVFFRVAEDMFYKLLPNIEN